MQSVEDFLKQGGKVQVIPFGETAYEKNGKLPLRSHRKNQVAPLSDFPRQGKTKG